MAAKGEAWVDHITQVGPESEYLDADREQRSKYGGRYDVCGQLSAAVGGLERVAIEVD